MMYLLLYLIDVLYGIGELLVLVVGISIVGLIILAILMAADGVSPCDEDAEKFKKPFKILMTTLIVPSIFLALIPSKSTLYTMAALYLGKKVSVSTGMNKKMEKVSKVIDLELDKALKNLQEESK